MAGGWPKSRLGGRTCIEIATGAPIPAGADAVEMVENTEVEKNWVIVKRPVAPGENVLKRGSDVQKGQVVAKRGKLLGPAELGAIAAAGVEKVKVFSKPKVAVISSGSELVTPGRKLGPGKVYDVNGWTLSAAVSSCGAEPIYLGIVPDRPSQIKSMIKKALKQSDAVLVSGGSSAGAGDLIPSIVEKMGKLGLIFHGLAMKPGKPAFAAVIGGKPVFGLPGYPVSALMIFDQLAADYLRELSGISEQKKPTVSAKLTTKVVLARGRRELLPVKLVRKNKSVYAEPILKGSGAITSLLTADGYVDSPAEKEFIQEGELVHVKLFGGWGGD
jgi:putative molybdopterin biosynthesis protein